MAQPKRQLPQRTVEISCLKCKAKLLKYHKNGKGALVKCFVQRIAKDYTLEPGICPQCGSQFARMAMIRGAPALKMLGSKVSIK